MNNDLLITYETGLIGSILLDGSCISRVIDLISPGDFLSSTCAAAYESALDLYTSGAPVEILTIIDGMIKRGCIDEDSRRFARDVMLMQASSANAEVYAKGIRDESRMRRITSFLTSKLMTPSDPDTLIDEVIEELSAIERGGKKGSAVTLKAALVELAQWAMSEEETNRLETGHGRIDKILNGLYPGNLIMLAARPSIGKSAYAANLALSAAERGVVSVIFSCEMETLEIVQRYLANRASIELDDIIDKSFADDAGKLDRALKSMNEMTGLPLHIYDEPGISVADIRRTLQTIRNVGLVVIDYIQLMESVEKGETRNLEVAKISGALKRMAREFKIPIVALSQLNRSKDEYDEPGLNDLRDSGALEQDADKVMLMWKLGLPEGGDLPKIGIKIAKNRMGKLGTVVMYYKGEYMRFMETAEEYVPRKKRRGRQFETLYDRDPDFPFD